MKTCFKCQEEKHESEFYRHPRMADGRLGKCIECTKADVNRNRKEKADYYQEYDRMRFYRDYGKRCKAASAWSLKNKEAAQRVKAKYAAQNPQKRKAQSAVSNAIRSGLIKRRPCVRCGSAKRVHGHHEDYDKPLDIVWLCSKCHGLRHAEINEERRKNLTVSGD